MRVLGINAIFHDPAAALVVDGRVVAAAEEERFSRRKHGKRPVPFAAWELPELSAAWCLAEAGVEASRLDAVAYSFDPGLCRPADQLGLSDPWDWLRIEYAKRAPQFLAAALPGLDPDIVRFVPHHVAHAASAGLAAPPLDARTGGPAGPRTGGPAGPRTGGLGGVPTGGSAGGTAPSPVGGWNPPAGDLGDPTGDRAVLVLDGRGETASHLAGVYRNGELTTLAAQSLPHSLGLLYEDLTESLGFLRSSDEYKVMALASYGSPKFLPMLRELIRTTGDGGFAVERIDWSTMAKPPTNGEFGDEHADMACSVQARLEEVLLELARWTYDAAGGPRTLTMAGGVALNCVANARIAEQGPYERVWVQPAAGDAGTALGAALHVARHGGEPIAPMPGAALGRGWSDEEIEADLRRAGLPYTRPASIAAEAAQVLAGGGLVAWYQGRAEYGPRALGHRSLLAHPGEAEMTRRLNEVKGREQFRPVAPMVLADRADEIFSGVLPSPYMLFIHAVRPQWRERLRAVTHVDGTARVQTVSATDEPLVAELLTEFDRLTGVPVVVNTSLNTAGRPIVDTPREAMELFGSAPVDLLAIGPYAVHRAAAFRRPARSDR